MHSYTKLFSSIITSTIWMEDDKTRILWITLLAMSDQHGEVYSSVPGLARVSGMTVAQAVQSLDKLLAPDPYSRTPDYEGRRIAPIDGGWEILNHAKYRLLASREDSKTATAARVRRHRERNAGVNSVTPVTPNVTVCNAKPLHGNAPVTDRVHIADIYPEVDRSTQGTRDKVSLLGVDVGADKAALLKEHQRFVVPTLDELAQNGERIGLTQNEVEKFQSHYESNGWRVGKNKMKNWRAAMSGWKTRVDEYNAKRTNDTRPNGHINSRNAQMGDGQRLNSERSAAESKAIDDAYTLDGRIPMS
jgi:hypothetical protein